MVRLKHDGHAKEYWNGAKYIQFNREGFYDATPSEARILLNCHGISLAEDQPEAEPAAVEETVTEEAPAEEATPKGGRKKAK